MHLIVGLGNPGSKYTFTRHNVGFLCIEHGLDVLSEAGISVPDPKSEHKSHTWKVRLGANEVLFVEPQTFMNLSGEAVQALMAYYKIPLENILIIQDDLDLTFGRMKFLKNRGAGGHNGIRNISEKLGPDYARLKLGVGAPRHPGQEGADFVLEKFTEDEAKKLGAVFDRALESIKSFIEHGYEKTINVFNRKDEPETDDKDPKKKED